jgi:hypothetical protein
MESKLEIDIDKEKWKHPETAIERWQNGKALRLEKTQYDF